MIEDVACIQVNAIRLLVYRHDRTADIQGALDSSPGDLEQKNVAEDGFPLAPAGEIKGVACEWTHVLLAFGVAQDPCFQHKVSLKETSDVISLV